MKTPFNEDQKTALLKLAEENARYLPLFSNSQNIGSQRLRENLTPDQKNTVTIIAASLASAAYDQLPTPSKRP
ncbi:MAG: hypothetical protein DHS20C10_11890 [marine bacterium B5-7]|nr:MAG: hypothetical protein DHS20C10_11890 [marine bacterium B5-7]